MTREEKEIALYAFCDRCCGCMGCLLEYSKSCDFSTLSTGEIDYLHHCITSNIAIPEPESERPGIESITLNTQPEEEKYMTDSRKLKVIDALAEKALETNFEGDDKALLVASVLIAIRAIVEM